MSLVRSVSLKIGLGVVLVAVAVVAIASAFLVNSQQSGSVSAQSDPITATLSVVNGDDASVAEGANLDIEITYSRAHDSMTSVNVGILPVNLGDVTELPLTSGLTPADIGVIVCEPTPESPEQRTNLFELITGRGVIIPAGTTSVTCTLPILEDGHAEEDETVRIFLYNIQQIGQRVVDAPPQIAASAQQGHDDNPRVTLTSERNEIFLALSDTIVDEGEELTITIGTNNPSSTERELTLNIEPLNDTPVTLEDFGLSSSVSLETGGSGILSAVLTLPANEDTRDFTLDIDENMDSGCPGRVSVCDESFLVYLDAVDGYSLDGSASRGGRHNDPVTIQHCPNPAVSILHDQSIGKRPEVREGSIITFTAELDCASYNDTEVFFGVNMLGTNLAGTDFVGLIGNTGSIVFPAYTTTKTFTIEVADDDDFSEANETFEVYIQSGRGYAVEDDFGLAGSNKPRFIVPTRGQIALRSVDNTRISAGPFVLNEGEQQSFILSMCCQPESEDRDVAIAFVPVNSAATRGGQDLILPNGNGNVGFVTIPAGQTSVTFEIGARDDLHLEELEEVYQVYLADTQDSNYVVPERHKANGRVTPEFRIPARNFISLEVAREAADGRIVEPVNGELSVNEGEAVLATVKFYPPLEFEPSGLDINGAVCTANLWCPSIYIQPTSRGITSDPYSYPDSVFGDFHGVNRYDGLYVPPGGNIGQRPDSIIFEASENRLRWPTRIGLCAAYDGFGCPTVATEISEATFRLPIRRDGVGEADEKFTLHLGDLTNSGNLISLPPADYEFAANTMRHNDANVEITIEGVELELVQYDFATFYDGRPAPADYTAPAPLTAPIIARRSTTISEASAGEHGFAYAVYRAQFPTGGAHSEDIPFTVQLTQADEDASTGFVRIGRGTERGDAANGADYSDFILVRPEVQGTVINPLTGRDVPRPNPRPLITIEGRGRTAWTDGAGGRPAPLIAQQGTNEVEFVLPAGSSYVEFWVATDNDNYYEADEVATLTITGSPVAHITEARSAYTITIDSDDVPTLRVINTPDPSIFAEPVYHERTHTEYDASLLVSGLTLEVVADERLEAPVPNVFVEFDEEASNASPNTRGVARASEMLELLPELAENGITVMPDGFSGWPVSFIDDDVWEDQEEFLFRVADSPTGAYQPASDNTAGFLIVDDRAFNNEQGEDDRPTFTVNTPSIAVDEGDRFDVTVELNSEVETDGAIDLILANIDVDPNTPESYDGDTGQAHVPRADGRRSLTVPYDPATGGEVTYNLLLADDNIYDYERLAQIQLLQDDRPGAFRGNYNGVDSTYNGVATFTADPADVPRVRVAPNQGGRFDEDDGFAPRLVTDKSSFRPITIGATVILVNTDTAEFPADIDDFGGGPIFLTIDPAEHGGFIRGLQAHAVRTIDVSDNEREQNERFRLQLVGRVDENGHRVGGGIGPIRTSLYEIRDDDVPYVYFANCDTGPVCEVAEGEMASFNLVVDPPVRDANEFAIRVLIEPNPDSAQAIRGTSDSDFGEFSREIVFTADDIDEVAGVGRSVLRIPIADDYIDEVDERFTVRIMDDSSDANPYNVGVTPGLVGFTGDGRTQDYTIKDNDTTAFSLVHSHGEDRVDVGEGEQIEFVLHTTHALDKGEVTPVPIGIFRTSGYGDISTEFTGLTVNQILGTALVVFVPGSLAAGETVSVTIGVLDDLIPETNEHFWAYVLRSFNPAHPVLGYVRSEGFADTRPNEVADIQQRNFFFRIVDNDPVEYRFANEISYITEGEPGGVPVVFANGLEREFSAPFSITPVESSTSASASDYSIPSDELSFTSAQLPVAAGGMADYPITATEDDVYEADSFTLTSEDVSSTTLVIRDGSRPSITNFRVVSLLDGRENPLLPENGIQPSIAIEATIAVPFEIDYELGLNVAPYFPNFSAGERHFYQGTSVVDRGLTARTTLGADTDFDSAIHRLNFRAGEITARVELTLLADGNYEIPFEEYRVELMPLNEDEPGYELVGNDGPVGFTIQDMDVPRVSLRAREDAALIATLSAGPLRPADEYVIADGVPFDDFFVRAENGFEFGVPVRLDYFTTGQRNSVELPNTVEFPDGTPAGTERAFRIRTINPVRGELEVVILPSGGQFQRYEIEPGRSSLRAIVDPNPNPPGGYQIPLITDISLSPVSFNVRGDEFDEFDDERIDADFETTGGRPLETRIVWSLDDDASAIVEDIYATSPFCQRRNVRPICTQLTVGDTAGTGELRLNVTQMDNGVVVSRHIVSTSISVVEPGNPAPEPNPIDGVKLAIAAGTHTEFFAVNVGEALSEVVELPPGVEFIFDGALSRDNFVEIDPGSNVQIGPAPAAEAIIRDITLYDHNGEVLTSRRPVQICVPVTAAQLRQADGGENLQIAILHDDDSSWSLLRTTYDARSRRACTASLRF